MGTECNSALSYAYIRAVGIVDKPQDYIYSSASNYVDGKGIIAVELVAIPIVNVLKPNSILKHTSYD